MKYINIPLFVSGFCIGIICVYLLRSGSRVIYVYPTPENVDVIQYKDKAGVCFRPTEKSVTCPNDKTKIKQVEPQF